MIISIIKVTFFQWKKTETSMSFLWPITAGDLFHGSWSHTTETSYVIETLIV